MSGLFAQLRTLAIRGRAPDDERNASDAAPESLMVDLFEAREKAPRRTDSEPTPIDSASRDGSQGQSTGSAERAASLRMPRNRPRTSVSSIFGDERQPAHLPQPSTTVRSSGNSESPSRGRPEISTQAESLVSQVRRLRVVREEDSRQPSGNGIARFDNVPTAEDGSILLECPTGEPEEASREVVGRPYHVNPYWRRTTSEALDLRRMIEERRRQLTASRADNIRAAEPVHHTVESRLSGGSGSPADSDGRVAEPMSSRASKRNASVDVAGEARSEADHDAADETQMREKLRSELMWVVQSWPRLSPQVRDAVLAVVRSGLTDEASPSRSVAGV